jgi:hypothetical protein
MICYKDKIWCKDSGQCATMDCHRHLTKWQEERANKHDTAIVWASFREACKEYTPLVAKEDKQ